MDNEKVSDFFLGGGVFDKLNVMTKQRIKFSAKLGLLCRFDGEYMVSNS